MIKKFLAVFLAFAMLLAFAGCTGTGNTDTPTAGNTDHIREIKTKVAVADIPMAMALEKLKSDRSYAYEVTTYNSAQEAAELIKNSSADVAALPLDVAAKLFNETNGGVKILSVIDLSNLQVVTSMGSLNSPEALKGKTVFATGKGTVYEHIINHVLSENGIDPEKDVDIQYSDDPAALVKQAIADKKGNFILPEPYATQIVAGTLVEQPANPTTQTATEADILSEDSETTTAKKTSTTSIFGKKIDFAREFGKLNNSPLVYGCVVARTEYINANPDIISEFMTFCEVSVNFIGGNIEQATIFFTSNGYFDTDLACYNSIISSNLTFLDGEALKTGVSKALEILYAADPTPIGGALPDESFYY